jgi:hypothetical protein
MGYLDYFRSSQRIIACMYLVCYLYVSSFVMEHTRYIPDTVQIHTNHFGGTYFRASHLFGFRIPLVGIWKGSHITFGYTRVLRDSFQSASRFFLESLEIPSRVVGESGKAPLLILALSLL